MPIENSLLDSKIFSFKAEDKDCTGTTGSTKTSNSILEISLPSNGIKMVFSAAFIFPGIKQSA